MSRICKTCGSLFKATGNEQECPTCKEGFNDTMSIIKGKDRTETVKDSTKTEAPPTTPEPSPKMYGKIEVKPEVAETPTKDVPVVDGTLNETRNDAVHHPQHYTLPGLTVESVDVIRAVLTPEEFKGWCKGNALKYSLRAGRKDPAKEVQDLAKAGVFLSWITGE